MMTKEEILFEMAKMDLYIPIICCSKIPKTTLGSEQYYFNTNINNTDEYSYYIFPTELSESNLYYILKLISRIDRNTIFYFYAIDIFNEKIYLFSRKKFLQYEIFKLINYINKQINCIPTDTDNYIISYTEKEIRNDTEFTVNIYIITKNDIFEAVKYSIKDIDDQILKLTKEKTKLEYDITVLNDKKYKILDILSPEERLLFELDKE